MRLAIQGLSEIRARLAAIRAEDIMAAALAEQAERLAQAVRDGLATPPGAGNHDRPWSRTGALHDSIAVQSNGLEAAIGSSDPAAAPQEMGTLRMPPRPFLAPVAASMGEEVARGVAEPVVAALKGETVSTSNKGRTQTVPYNLLGVVLPGSPENEEWARNTARGITALGRELGRIFHSEQQPPEENAQPEPAPSSLAKPAEATLPEDRRRYILDGDEKGGGGHGPGRNTPDKSNFPSDWSDDQAVEAITDVANDPASTRVPGFKGRTRVLGTRSGVHIEVVVGADGKTIITGYPTNVPRGSE